LNTGDFTPETIHRKPGSGAETTRGHDPAATRHGAPATSTLADRQRAFLLGQLAAAPDRRLGKGEANKHLPKEIGLSAGEANRLRDTLRREGYLQTSREKRALYYELTDEGEAYLQTLPPYAPPAPRAKGKANLDVDDDVRRWRKSYLLMQVLAGSGNSLSQPEANKKITRGIREHLELTAATANHLRQEFVDEHLLAVEMVGRQPHYTITAQGEMALGASEFYPAVEWKLKGEIINRLLEVVRTSAKQFERPEDGTAAGESAHAAAHHVPSSLSLEALAVAVMASVRHLLQEKYHFSGLVPIHEVRSEIREEYGADSAEHSVLDEVLLALEHERRLRLVSLSDLSEATPEQIEGAVRGVGETLFYIGTAHEPAAV
jgi:DNA-binding PadR family transcriptional regulator